VPNLSPSIGSGLTVTASLLAGALAAATLQLPARLAAIVTAFGGGTLLAAIALELVPEADDKAGAAPTALGLLAGTLIYVGADAYLNRDESMKSMRRSGHATAGRAMSMPRNHAERRRAESRSRSGSSSTGCPSQSHSGLRWPRATSGSRSW
jgi:hypothetical protein